MRRRFALVSAFAVLGACTALMGCGGSEEAKPAPELPRALGRDLAARADSVAASLDSGDPCQAAAQARGLQQAVEEAIAADEVPSTLRRQLVRAVDRLVSDVQPLCEPSEEEPPAGDPVSCAALEAEKKDLEERKKEIEEAFKDDEKERERRKKAIEEQMKALEEQLRECRDDDDDD